MASLSCLMTASPRVTSGRAATGRRCDVCRSVAGAASGIVYGWSAADREAASAERRERTLSVDVQRTGRIFGWFFIGTFVTSIPARLLFIDGLGASWSDMRFIPGDTSETSLKLGAVLEFGLIVTQIATAVVIYPLVRRQSETVSLGYVSARLMESVFAAIGLISIISVVNVADALASAGDVEATALAASGDSLVQTYEWAFQWGPGLVAGIGNGLMLGYLMYRSALVPPRMALLGLIGGPVLILNFVLKLCDVYEDGSALAGLLTLPEAAWELSLGIYCAWKGFRLDSPIARPEMAMADQGVAAPDRSGASKADRS